MSSKSIYRFYIYAYIRSHDSKNGKAGTPYYIGKGQDNRAWEKHFKVRVPKNKFNIVILESNLSEIGALALERRYIKWFGRLDSNSGILHNKTDGGEGGHGILHTEESKIKMSKAIREYHKNNPNIAAHSNETKAKISAALKGKPGKKHSTETKNKISQAQIGKKLSEKTKNKISSSLRGRPLEIAKVISICPHCGKSITGRSNFLRWHNDNCPTLLAF